ncbi:MAG: LacI family DNA-binding transcriptional regulator [Jatrophihabitans sp.]
MPTNIRGVASAAGVSPATVSRVLNGSTEVNQVMRERVLAAVRELGYRPNGAARSLRTRATMVLGIIISDITNPFFTAMVRGVEDTAQAAGYSVILANTDEDLTKEARYLEVAVAEQMAGVVLSPASSSKTRLDLLAEQGIPVVTIDRKIRGAACDSVTINNRAVARQATAHLIEQGCRRVGFIAGPPVTTTARERLAGYTKALQSAGVDVDERLIASSNYRTEGGYDATRALLSLPRHPDGLLVSNNLMTVGALDAISEAGLVLPRDLAFVGFDEVTWALGKRARVTAVQQPTYLIGQSAAELLLDRIRGDKSAPRHVVHQGELIVRTSSLREPQVAALAAAGADGAQ